MIEASALLRIVMTAVAAALIVGALTLLALRLLRRAALFVQLLVVTVGATVTIAAATVAIGIQMYLSGHDLVVLCWVIGCGAAASLAVAGILGLAVGHSARALAATVQAVGDGEVVPVRVGGSREFDELSRELAAGSEKLRAAREEVARLEASRRSMVAWISHDLRTPLAALQAMAESLEDGVTEDPARYYRQIRGQAETLAGMVDELFELSKIQSGTLRLNREPLALFDVVSDAVAELHPIAASRRILLREEHTGELTLWADPRELARVVGNLLMNAIQHSPPGSEILISARETSDQRVTLSVVDAGGGIPEEDLGRIFEPGWRGSSARTPEPATGRATGAGLGLAIVRGIVEAHNGGVAVRNVPGGARFDVVLPRSSAPVM